MRRWIIAMMVGAAVSVAGAGQAAPKRDPEAQLAKAIDGLVPGKPVNCITLRDIRSSRIIDRTAIVYDMGGGRLYVNRPSSGASSLRRDYVLVTNTHSPQLCNVDIVRLYDSGSRMQSGAVGLGMFTPYTKPGRQR